MKLNSVSAPLWVNYPYTSAAYYVNSTYSATGIKACKNYISRVALNYNNIYQTSLNGDETALKVLIANYGPVTVAMYVSPAFQNYRSGVFYDGVDCTKAGVAGCASVNHGEKKFMIKINFVLNLTINKVSSLPDTQILADKTFGL